MNPQAQGIKAFVLVGLLAFWGGSPAHASRPQVSETADALESGTCELEAGLARQSSRGAPKGTALALVGSCGNRWSSQFGVGLSQAWFAGERLQHAALVGKTTLVMPNEQGPGFGVAYGLSAERASGQGWTRTDAVLQGIVTQQIFKNLTGHANLGWQRSHRDQLNTTTWSVGLEGNHGLRWTADLYGADRSKPWASLGWLLPVGDKTNLSLAYARQLAGARDQQLTLGGRLEF